MNRSARHPWPQGMLCLLTVAALWCAGVAPAAASQFYVSPAGNDAWQGTLPKPDLLRRNGPFRTLERARNAVRAFRREPYGTGEVVVLLRAGIYVFADPFELGNEDSGRERGRTIYRAYPGEMVHFRGSVTVSGWQNCYNGSYRADLSQFPALPPRIQALFYRGQRQHLARSPNADPSHPHSGGFLYVGKVNENSATPRVYPEILPLSPAQCRDPDGINACIWSGIPPRQEAVALAAQGHDRYSLTLATRAQRQLPTGARFFLEGAFEMLDAPGEWYLDPETRQLYFRPPDQRHPGKLVTIPIATHLVDVRGNSGKKAGNITFEHISFSETTGAIIRIQHADQVEVMDSNLRNCQGAALEIGDACRRVRIARCEISRTGAEAIAIQGANQENREAAPSQHVITDNRIFATGQINNAAAAIRIGSPDDAREAWGTVISHNLVHDVPGPALQIYGSETVCQYNHLHHVNAATQSAAALDVTVPESSRPGGIIRHNWIHDSGGYAMKHPGQWAFPETTWGIRVGPGSGSLQIEGNCIHDAASACIRIEGGTAHRIQNNLLAGKTGTLLDIGGGAAHTLSHNLFFLQDPENTWLSTPDPAVTIAASDWNVAWSGENDLHARIGPDRQLVDWQEWQRRYADAQSLRIDPLLRNPEAGDFTIEAHSPALKLGFVPIPFDRIGLVQNAERHTWPTEEAPIREAYLLTPRPSPVASPQQHPETAAD